MATSPQAEQAQRPACSPQPTFGGNAMITALNLAHTPKLAANAIPKAVSVAISMTGNDAPPSEPLAPDLRSLMQCKDVRPEDFSPLKGLEALHINEARRRVNRFLDKIRYTLSERLEDAGLAGEAVMNVNGSVLYLVYLEPYVIIPSITADDIITLYDHPVGRMALSIVNRHFAPISEEVVSELSRHLLNALSEVMEKPVETFEQLHGIYQRADNPLKDRLDAACADALVGDHSPLSEYGIQEESPWAKSLSSVSSVLDQWRKSTKAASLLAMVDAVDDEDFIDACTDAALSDLPDKTRALANKIKTITLSRKWSWLDDLKTACDEAEVMERQGNILNWLIMECGEKLPLTLTPFEEAAVEMVNFWATEAGEYGRAVFESNEWSAEEVGEMVAFLMSL